MDEIVFLTKMLVDIYSDMVVITLYDVFIIYLQVETPLIKQNVQIWLSNKKLLVRVLKYLFLQDLENNRYRKSQVVLTQLVIRSKNTEIRTTNKSEKEVSSVC